MINPVADTLLFQKKKCKKIYQMINVVTLLLFLKRTMNVVV